MPGFEVVLEDACRRFPLEDGRTVTALADVSLTVPAGAALAVTGPSGSGKSTLLHLVGAMDRPDRGRVMVAGRDLGGLRRRELAAYRRTIGFVFQRFHLLPALTALDNVVAPALAHRVSFDRHARALINDPGLVMADEPTGNLDSTSGAEIIGLLLELRQRSGMTVLVATHDPAVASRCDRIVKLRDGAVVDDLTLPTDGPGTPLEAIERLSPGTT